MCSSDLLLGDIAAHLGDRRVAVARELTKLHEEVLRGRASEVLASIVDRDVKGEVAVVIEGAATPEADLATLVAEARALVAKGSRKRDAAATVARGTGIATGDVYAALLDERP